MSEHHTHPPSASERQLSRDSIDIAKRLEQAENKIEALKQALDEAIAVIDAARSLVVAQNLLDAARPNWTAMQLLALQQCHDRTEAALRIFDGAEQDDEPGIYR